ncbi:glycosyltransferase [Primorskyibacter flagellatus]|uniref:Glycosyltransferase involved in cell wall bisynthesis n=1 Tax=Primorskyibacter flagellatus TaxID=1387277 RepID=A0A1W2ELT5_9RHOB|nr:glycosyltransferase [Primorskyibacter flagellatus]SMD10701.1 Glycosyltransferase involved in cell wall bisynthesis [Primorskyibacter flagellatus]
MSILTDEAYLVPKDAMSSKNARDVFDPEFYLEQNPDIREAGVDPWQHYIDQGGREGRDPAPWFSGAFYRAHVLQQMDLLDVANPLEHWLTVGRDASFSPSEHVEADLLARAKELFDASFYLELYPDIAESEMDPWEHFIQFGWHEGRAPFADFDAAYYLHRLITEGGFGMRRNPLLHWVAVGRDAGWVTEADEPFNMMSDPAERSLRALIGMFDDAAEPLPEDDAVLISRSGLFDPAHLALHDPAYADLDRLAAAQRYLRLRPAKAPDPSALFAAQFYYELYADRMGSGQSALVHYLRRGRTGGLPISPEAAWLDVLRLRQIEGPQYSYHKQLRHAPRRADQIEDYVLHGVASSTHLTPEVDETFVRDLYTRLVPGGIGAPAAFVARSARSGWVYPTVDAMRYDADSLHDCAVFDPDYYSQQANLTDDGINPAEHYVTAGVQVGLATSPEFSTEHYIMCNMDLATARVVPAVHFDKYGRSEGRVAHSTITEHSEEAKVTHNSERPTVLVMSHEASRTGAPIVALNIVRTLAETHNVISWIDADGPLREDFGEISTRLLAGYGTRQDMQAILEGIQRDTGLKVAIVSSVVSSFAVLPLRLAGVPTISLIHEFADYVAPFGKMSRMALYSDISVFPAKLVRAACTREIDALGLGPVPERLRIRPQGYNVAGGDQKVDLDAQDILDLIDAPADPSRRRIMFGAGWVQPRKGVDLFLQVAAALKDDPDYNWRFIWVGGNYHPDTDMGVSIFLAHQMREAGLSSQMTFLPEQKTLDPFWEISDIFLMSSRLDPYPNVALEALYHSVPVVCFEGATGIAELKETYPFAVQAAPFADIEGAAQHVRKLVHPKAGKKFSGAVGKKMRAHLSFETYVSDLVEMIEPAQETASAATDAAHAFEALSKEDLALAARHLPSRLCLSTVAYPAVLRQSLGELASYLGLEIDPQTGALLGAAGNMAVRDAAGLRPWQAGGGLVEQVGQPGDVELLIHVADKLAFDTVAALLKMLPREEMMVCLVAGLPWLVAPLKEIAANFPDRSVRVEDRTALRASEAAGRLAAREGPTYVAVVCARAEFDVPNTLAAPESGVMAALLSGAATAFLEEHADCPAVLGAMSTGNRSAKAEERADEQAQSYAPRFCGVYRRETLYDFAITVLPRVTAQGAGLTAKDWDCLAAIHFLREHSTTQKPTMLPILPAL